MLKTSLIIYFLSLFLALSCCAGEKIVIDVDAGSDDAIAMLLLLEAEARKESPFEVLAITCSYGNVDENTVETNVLKTLTIANRSDIPVYAGSKKPLIGHFSSESIFGKDGFGDFEFSREILGKVDRSKHASVALVELSKEHEGNLSLVILGPTTNVALAASLDNEFAKRIKSFHAMGSSVSGFGLYKPNVEFNFGADAEANHILLNASSGASQLRLFPWEAAFEANFSADWRRDVFGRRSSPYVEFLNAVEALALGKADAIYAPADAMAVAAMLRPEMIKASFDTSVLAVVDGAARGSVLVEYRPKRYWQTPENARIVRAIDIKAFERIMIDLLG